MNHSCGGREEEDASYDPVPLPLDDIQHRRQQWRLWPRSRAVAVPLLLQRRLTSRSLSTSRLGRGPHRGHGHLAHTATTRRPRATHPSPSRFLPHPSASYPPPTVCTRLLCSTSATPPPAVPLRPPPAQSWRLPGYLHSALHWRTRWRRAARAGQAELKEITKLVGDNPCVNGMRLQ